MRHRQKPSNGFHGHGHGTQDDSQGTVEITRHAVDRYTQRARPTGTPRRIARQISQRVIEAFDEGNVFRVDNGTHLVPLAGACRPMCAVVQVSGPVQKPFAIVVCTVLTVEMALATHGHLSGLIPALDSARRAA